MRLLKLKLENITSLKGKHTIDFSEISKQSDLFAITGPTGSGKSSLLMAMAMALYGQNHKGLNAPDLVTTHCPYGKIEVEFSLHGKIYNVKWNCQTLKKDGTPRKTPLTQRSWQENGVEIEKDAQDIIGLSWDQFTKVIILNQGQFSEFLTSTFNKRKEILEKLMGHGQLEVLSKALRRKLSALEAEIDALEGQTSFAVLMSEEQYLELCQHKDALDKYLEDINTITINHSEIEKKLKEDIALKEKSIEISKQYHQKNILQESLQAQITKAQINLKSSDKELNDTQSLYKERRPFLKEAIHTNDRLERTQLKQSELQKNIEHTIQQKSKKDSAHKEINQTISELKQKEAEILSKGAIQSDSAEIQENTRLASQKIVQLEKLIEIRQSHCAHKDEIKDEGTKSKNDLFEKINKNLIANLEKDHNTHSNNIIEAFKAEEIPKLQSLLIEMIDELEINLKEAKTNQEELKKQSLEIEYNQKNAQALEAEIKDSKSRITQLESTLKDKLHSFELLNTQLANTKIVNQRWNLLKLTYDHLHQETGPQHEHSPTDQECPVCSSKEVQWDQVFKPLDELAGEDLSKQEKLEEELKVLNRTIDSVTLEREHLHKGTLDKEIELTKISTLIENQSNAMEKNLKQNKLSNEEELQYIIEKTREVQYELSNYLKARERLVIRWKQAEAEVSTDTLNIKDLSTELEALITRLLEFDPTLEHLNYSELLSSIIPTPDQILQISKLKEKCTLIYKKIDVEIKRSQELSLVLERLKLSTKNSLSIEQDLSELDKLSTQYEQENKTLANEVTSLTNTISAKKYPKAPQEELDSLEEKLEMVRNKREQSNKEKIDIDTRYRQGSEQINNLKDRMVELEKLHILYIEEIGQSIETLTTLEQNEELNTFLENAQLNFELPLLYLKNQSNFIEHLKKYTQKEWNSLQREEVKNSDDKQVNNFELDKTFLSESVSPQAEQSKNTFMAMNQKKAALEQEIKTYQEQQKRIEKLSQEINVKKSQRDRFEVLNHYIGKDRFRDFALTILENTLLEMANHEISSLAEGRYELLHAKAGKRSEFMVKDHWHGGIERKVSTLSGGETFLLSLGLAMGLSDITRGQTEIESFFIDEGFGTLDDESIGQVLDCLMAIQSRGKQIGLISHVTSLTSQIPVRLEVTKNNFGESTLQIS